MQIKQESVNEVPFRIFDFTAPEHGLQSQGLEPGFYYDIPMPEDARVAPGQVFLKGPFLTSFKARDAALLFIQDALTEKEEA